MNNYQQFKTLSKTNSCTFYEAFDRNLFKQVLLKRIPKKQSWDRILTNSNFIFSQKQSIFTKIIEVFKHKNYFFISYQRPNGPPLSSTDEVGKLQIGHFFMVFSDLCQMPNAYVQPQWIFLHRNHCKIGHFEPYYSQQNDVHSHVYMYNLSRAKQKQYSTTSEPNPQFLDKNTNLTFGLGCIAYQLLTGKKALQAQNQEQYKQKSQLFITMCQNRILKATKHEKLAQFVGKMVSKNSLLVPTFQQIKNFSYKYNQQYNSKSKSPMAIEVQFEKIKLQKADTNKKIKKFLRPCCKTVEEHKHSKKVFLLNSSEFIQRPDKTRVLSKGKSMLPQIISNRHRMSLRKSIATHKTKPTMFMSQDLIANQC